LGDCTGRLLRRAGIRHAGHTDLPFWQRFGLE
jgi:hypothetical protein